MILIVAGNFEQANNIARENKLAINVWRYAHSRDMLLSYNIKDNIVWVGGTYYMSRDAVSMLAEAKAKGFDVIHK